MKPFQKTHFGKGLKSKRRLFPAVPMKIRWPLEVIIHSAFHKPICSSKDGKVSVSFLDFINLKARKNQGGDSAECPPRSSDFPIWKVHPAG